MHTQVQLPLMEQLTRQEIRILRLAAQDFTNKEIADQLNISAFTVKKHRANIYRKCEIQGRVAIRKLLRQLNMHWSSI